MSYIVARLKIFPKDAGINPKQMEEAIRSALPSWATLLSSGEEPVAFGIVSLMADFKLKDSQGVMDRLEECVKGVSLVGELQVVGVSRSSVLI